ncbi:hypothetical protein Tco_0561942 [Tanacetum coccineum]
MGGFWVLIDFQTITTKEKFMANTSVVSWFSHLQQAMHNILIEERAIWVNIDGVPLKVWTKNTFNRIASKWGELIYDDDQEEMSFHNKRICVLTKLKESISESFKIIVQGKVFWVRAKEECGWTPDFVEEEENENEYDEMVCNEGDHEENGNNPNSVVNDSDIDEVPDTHPLRFHCPKNLSEAGCNVGTENILHQKDPSDSYFELPPGFTPSVADEDKREDLYVSGDENEIRSKYVQVEVISPCEKEKEQNKYNGWHNDIHKHVYSGGSILQVIEDMVKVGKTMGYNMEGCINNIEDIIKSQGVNDGYR